MIIDLHFHTKYYSSCSGIELEEGIKKAKEMGLDGICLTEHDVFAEYDNISELQIKYQIKIFVGIEIFTTDGDILCFGLDEIPHGDIAALELVDYVESINGASIAAHPYRDNDRGIKDNILELKNLTAIEVFNGNTSDIDNTKAYDLSLKNKLNMTGSSDAHSLGKIGCFATKFAQEINTLNDLINELKKGRYQPVKYDDNTKVFIDLI